MKHNLVLNLTNPTLATTLAIVEKINLNIEIHL